MTIPEALAVRVLVGVWWLAVIVILGCYSGTLTSFMMYPGYKKSLDDIFMLVDAVEKGYYTWGTVKGSSCMTEFEKTHSELLKKLADNTKQRLIVSNVSEGVQEVKHQNYGFFYNELNMLFEMPANHKKYYVMSADYIRMDFMALAFQKNFLYQELFNSFIRRAVKAGLVQKWMNDITFYHFYKIDKNTTTPFSDNERPLNLTDLQGAFYILGFGSFLSAICLVVEWLFW
ncbi:ionotropic receptor 21a-like [Limulus polyphemus]|uniref:Ionotropic receptor 21a-like n=1 Tax=Limulus polyphemus TaxID=6850 RepID=A0ABM1S8Z9_LIMPO|nr:ionotropic receptor 21a-like [Limulus polyphemus]